MQQQLIFSGNASIRKSVEILGDDRKIPDLTKGLYQHCTTLLNNRTVLVIGGITESNGFSSKTYKFKIGSKYWEDAPGLTTGRHGHACARIFRFLPDPNRESVSVIVVGGRGPDVDLPNGGLGVDLKSVEVLDDDSGDWKPGPELPLEIYKPTLAEDGQGGVILLGGRSDLDLRVLYRLKTLEDGWTEMTQRHWRIGRTNPVAFLIPDEMCTCKKERTTNQDKQG